MRRPRNIDLRQIEKDMPEFGTVQNIEVSKRRKGRQINYSNDLMATVDEDEQETLGVFNKNYNMIPHQEVLEKVREVIGRDTIQGNLWNRSLPDRLYLYYYPDEWEAETGGQTGDVVKFGLRVTNSMDGNNSLGAHLVAFRLVCANGMFVQDLVEGSYHKHTTEGSVEMFESELESIIETGFDEALEKYKRARRFKAKPKVVLERLNIPESLEEKVVGSLEERESLFDIYNATTEKITHGFIEDADGNLKDSDNYAESTLERRQREAAKILKLPDEQDNVEIVATE